MKLCLCCAKGASDAAVTCPACGEGSWGAVSQSAAAPEPDALPVGRVEPTIDLPEEPSAPSAAEPETDVKPVHVPPHQRRRHWR